MRFIHPYYLLLVCPSNCMLQVLHSHLTSNLLAMQCTQIPNSMHHLTLSMLFTGNGISRPRRTSRSPAEPKILANEMELLRKVFPPGESSVLQCIPAVRYSFYITAHDKHTGATALKHQREYSPRSRVKLVFSKIL